MPEKLFVTSFCNQPHRIRDGVPVNHECYVLPTPALDAERQGKLSIAQDLLTAWKNRRRHNGVRYKETASDG